MDRDRSRELRSVTGRRRLGSVACAAVFFAVTAVAGAQSWSRLVPLPPLGLLAESGSGIVGFALAGGDGVAWLERRGARFEAYVVGPLGSVIDVGGVTLPAGAGGGGALYPNVLATSSLVAIQVAYMSCDGHPNMCSRWRSIGAVFPIHGLLRPAAGCDLSAPLAVSGTVVATSTRICDLASGASWLLPAGTVAARVAGDVAAVVLPNGSLQVEDWRSGTVLYQVHAPPFLSFALTAPAPLDSRQFDVQGDGTTVFGASDGELEWASPSDPQPHPFFSTTTGLGATPPPVTTVGPLRLSNGLVAIARTVGSQPSVEVVNLGGTQVAFRPLYGQSVYESGGYVWDSAGAQLGWFTRPCQEGEFAVASVDQAASFAPAPPGPCPAPSLSDSKPDLLAGRTLRIEYKCPLQATLGCVAETTLVFRARPARREPVRDGFSVQRGPLLAADPGTSRQVEVRLTRGALRLLACHRSVRVTVSARGAENAVAPPGASTPRTRVDLRLAGGGRRCR